MMYNDKRQVPFEDEMNRSGRTHTSSIWNIKIDISYKVTYEVIKGSNFIIIITINYFNYSPLIISSPFLLLEMLMQLTNRMT